MLDAQSQPRTVALKKSWIAWGICLNTGAAVVLFFAVDFSVLVGKTIILSNFREWHLNGVFSDEGLNAYKDGLYSREWTALPDDLKKRAFRYVEYAKILCVSLPVVNAVILFCIFRQGCERKSTGGITLEHPPDDE